jgi:DNA polymerase III subunit gamma/tau
VRDTLSVLEQVLAFAGVESSSGRGGEVSAEAVAAVLGHTPLDRVVEAVDLLGARDLGGLLALVQGLADEGHDLRRFTLDLVQHLRDLLVLQVAPDRPDLVDATDDRRRRLQAQTAVLPQEAMLRAVARLADTLAEQRLGTPRLPLELALATLATPGADGDVVELAERIARLEAGAPPTGAGDPARAPATARGGEASPARVPADGGSAGAAATSPSAPGRSSAPRGPAPGGPSAPGGSSGPGGSSASGGADEPVPPPSEPGGAEAPSGASGAREAARAAAQAASGRSRPERRAASTPSPASTPPAGAPAADAPAADAPSRPAASASAPPAQTPEPAGTSAPDGAPRAPAPADTPASAAAQPATSPSDPAPTPTQAEAADGPAAGPAAAPAAAPSAAPADDTEQVLARWDGILELVKQRSRRCHAVYEPSTPLRVRNRILTLRYPTRYASFHAANATKGEFSNVLSDAIEQSTGLKLRIDAAIEGADARRPSPPSVTPDDARIPTEDGPSAAEMSDVREAEAAPPAPAEGTVTDELLASELGAELLEHRPADPER